MAVKSCKSSRAAPKDSNLNPLPALVIITKSSWVAALAFLVYDHSESDIQRLATPSTNIQIVITLDIEVSSASLIMLYFS